MNALPAILKYGLPGLAAIIVFLAYQLLLSQSKKKSPNRSILQTIKVFMALGVVLAIISAIGSVTELMTNVKHQKSLDDLRSRLQVAQQENEHLKKAQGSEEKVVQLRQELENAKARVKQLQEASVSQQEATQLRADLAEAQKSLQAVERTAATQRAALDRHVADRLEQALWEHRDKLQVVPESERTEVRRSLLRRAVFLNMRAFEADPNILSSALACFVRHGHSDLTSAVDEVVTDFPKLRVSRFRWLQDQAIPTYNEAMQKRTLTVTQASWRVDVPLPHEFVIKDVAQFGPPTVSVTDTDIAMLREEVEFLKKSL